MRKTAVFICLALAACAPRPDPLIQGNPEATVALLALPEAQFFAEMQLAQQVATACNGIGFNQRFSQALIAQRFGAGRRGLAAAANTRAIDLERDVGTRSLQARYDVDLNEADLCAVASGELIRKSPLSAVLLPI